MSKHRNTSVAPDAVGLYGPDHVPDPVTEGAVAAAMAATDRQPNHPTWERLAWALGVFFFVVASFASVLGLINTIQISHQNAQLKKQADCLTSVVLQFEDDQLNRASITADDREAIRALVKRVFTATTVNDKIKAYNDFVKTSNNNDARRALIGTQLKPDCKLPGVHISTKYKPQPLLATASKHPLPTTSKPRIVSSLTQHAGATSSQISFQNTVARTVAETPTPTVRSSLPPSIRPTPSVSVPTPSSILCTSLPLIKLCP